MKNYRNVLIVLDSSGTDQALKNKYVKLAHSTEDLILKDLCLKMGQWWGWYLKRGTYRRMEDPNTGAPVNVGIPKNQDEWIVGYQSLSAQLREYCETTISRGKPEWMLLAERHGWRPPH